MADPHCGIGHRDQLKELLLIAPGDGECYLTIRAVVRVTRQEFCKFMSNWANVTDLCLIAVWTDWDRCLISLARAINLVIQMKFGKLEMCVYLTNSTHPL